METFLLRLNELENVDSKRKLIDEIFNNGNNTFDAKISGTQTRVCSLYRIINSDREIEALKIVIASNRVARKNPQAVIAAKDLLRRIENEEFRACSHIKHMQNKPMETTKRTIQHSKIETWYMI